jgi:hypothetical protein
MSAEHPIRKTERLEIVGEMMGEVMVYQPMAIRQISRAGAMIETAFPLQVDSLHDLRLMLGDVPIVVKARIVHSHVTEVEDQGVLYAIGVEYVQPSDYVVEAIGEFIRRVGPATQTT